MAGNLLCLKMYCTELKARRKWLKEARVWNILLRNPVIKIKIIGLWSRENYYYEWPEHACKRGVRREKSKKLNKYKTAFPLSSSQTPKDAKT